MKARELLRRLLSILLLLVGHPVVAQTLCIECLNATDKELNAHIEKEIIHDA